MHQPAFCINKISSLMVQEAYNEFKKGLNQNYRHYSTIYSVNKDKTRPTRQDTTPEEEEKARKSD
jgi:hypothetical protein